MLQAGKCTAWDIPLEREGQGLPLMSFLSRLASTCPVVLFPDHEVLLPNLNWLRETSFRIKALTQGSPILKNCHNYKRIALKTGSNAGGSRISCVRTSSSLKNKIIFNRELWEETASFQLLYIKNGGRILWVSFSINSGDRMFDVLYLKTPS